MFHGVRLFHGFNLATLVSNTQFVVRVGFVAQIRRRTLLALPHTGLAYRLRNRYAKSRVAVEDSDADVDLCNLPIKTPHHQRLAK